MLVFNEMEPEPIVDRARHALVNVVLILFFIITFTFIIFFVFFFKLYKFFEYLVLLMILSMMLTLTTTFLSVSANCWNIALDQISVWLLVWNVGATGRSSGLQSKPFLKSFVFMI